MKLASILNVPGHTGISEYIKEVWEESKYIKPLEITRKFANNSSINVARRVQSTEMKPFQRFVHFVVMKNRYNKLHGFDIHGSSAQEEEVEGGNQAEFDWEAVVDEAAVEGESRSDEQFYDAQVDVEEPMTETQLLRSGCSSFSSAEGNSSIRSRPLVSHWSNSRSSDEQITS
ncbi:hypothetical protein Dimus_018657 [Dionaea muscipula]